MLIPKSLIQDAKSKLGEESAFIIAKDLKLENWDDRNLKSLCPFHHEETGSFIFNNKPNTFYFKCFGCGIRYGIIDHFISYYNLSFLDAIEKLFNLVKINYLFQEKGLQTERDYKYPKYEVSQDRKKVEEYFLSRCISKETLDYCDVRQSKDRNIIWNFYNENDVLLTVKCRPARKVNKNEPKEWYLPGFDYTPILYNMNKVSPDQPLLICEGQADCLAIIESGYKNVVSIPGGTENMKWIEICYDWLEQFDKIIIFFDNDIPGIKARKEAIARLGNYRCLYVDLPFTIENKYGELTRVKDANEVLFYTSKDKLLELIKNAKELPISGILDLSKADDFDLEKAEGLFLNLETIDKLLYKLLFGSVALLTGVRGHGKSSLLNQIICESLNQDYDVFYFGSELGPEVTKSWVEVTMAGPSQIEMKNEFVQKINDSAKLEIRNWYKEKIWFYDDIRNDIDVVLDKAVNVIRKYGAKTVVLDNLMCLDLHAGDTNVLQKQKDFIVKLVNLARIYNVLVILIAHPRKLQAGYQLDSDQISGSGDLGNLAQYILAVHKYTKKEKEGEKDSRGNYRKGKEPIEYDVRISVLKNRYTGRTGDANLYFDFKSRRFYTSPKEYWKRYSWDKDSSPLRSDDPNEHKPIPQSMKN